VRSTVDLRVGFPWWLAGGLPLLVLVVIVAVVAAYWLRDTQPPHIEELPALQVIEEVPAADWRLKVAVPLQYRWFLEADGKAALLEATESASSGGYASLQRSRLAEGLGGKRLRFSALLRTESVEGWGRLFLQVNGYDSAYLLFDDVTDVPLPATGSWQRYSVTIDVPEGSDTLMFGVQMGGGKGRAWIGDGRMDEVGPGVAVTPPNAARNLGFERGFTGWASTPGVQEYERGIDNKTARSGKTSAYLRGGGRDFGTFYQVADAVPYRGKRLQLTGYVKTQQFTEYAALWMQVDANTPARGYRREASDNMGDRPIKGAKEWTPYSVVLDVHPEATHLTFGVLLRGNGTIWLDDLSLEVVGEEVPTTGVNIPEQPNLSFDDKLTGWRNTHGSYEVSSYSAGSGSIVAKLTPRMAEPSGVGRLSQTVQADSLHGKKYRFSASVKATLRQPLWSHHGWTKPGTIAGIWARITGPNSSAIHDDMMAKDPIKDVTDWTRYSLEFTVPQESIYVSYGAYLYGVGEVEIKDVSLEEIK
jgi:hypothetical protein